MSSPPNPRSYYQALYDWSGINIFNHVRGKYSPLITKILDVGAGWGKYAELLPDYVMDACEIWGIYIENEMLWKKYRQVFPMDICDLVKKDIYHPYDLVIMGDVFEHIDRERAKLLIGKLTHDSDIILTVPYLYEQGEVEGNPYEAHQQSDLTPELMLKEYPQLKLLVKTDKQGIYIKK